MFEPTATANLRQDDAHDATNGHQPTHNRDDHAPVRAPHIVQIDDSEAREQRQQAGQIEHDARVQRLPIMLSYRPRLIRMPSAMATNVGPMSLARNNERSMMRLHRANCSSWRHAITDHGINMWPLS